MFNIGPGEFLVLAIVAVIVLGPDRLPGLARDAARMIRTLRELATGARTQLREELGPEFADLGLDELRNLNPKTALQRAILGDEDLGMRSQLRDSDPRRLARDLWNDVDEPGIKPAAAPGPVSPGTSSMGSVSMAKQPPLAPGEPVPWDQDAT